MERQVHPLFDLSARPIKDPTRRNFNLHLFLYDKRVVVGFARGGAVFVRTQRERGVKR
jgi:hypothetical protein